MDINVQKPARTYVDSNSFNEADMKVSNISLCILIRKLKKNSSEMALIKN